jgi:hypothetical protein
VVTRWLLAVVIAAGLLAATGSARATYPGLNGKVVFAGNLVGVTGLYAKYVDESGQSMIASDPNPNDGFGISKDGLTVVYAASTGGSTIIKTVPVYGGASTTFPGAVLNDTSPSFFGPDNRIVVTRSDGTGMSIVFPNGTRRNIGGYVADYHYPRDPSFSPNGLRIAFSRTIGGGINTPQGSNIYTVDLLGQNETLVANCAPKFCAHPSWSADSAVLTFGIGPGAINCAGDRVTSIPASSVGVVPNPGVAGEDGDNQGISSPASDGTLVVANCKTNSLSQNAGGAPTRRLVPVGDLSNGRVQWAAIPRPATPTPAPVPGPPGPPGPPVPPAPGVNNPPAFSAASACGVPFMVKLLGSAPASVSAADPDAGQLVTLTASASPSYVQVSPGAPGQTATATLTGQPLNGIFDFAFGLFGGGGTVTITATDNGSPAKSSECVIPVRPAIF